MTTPESATPNAQQHPHPHPDAQSNATSTGAIWIGAALLALCLFGAGLWWYLAGASLRITISEEQILERLHEQLPKRETYLYVLDVTYDSPRIELVEASERIKAGLDLSVKLNFVGDSTPLLGTIDAAFGIRYEADEGAFYLTEPTIEELALDGLPREWTNKARDLVGEGIRTYFDDHPIYRLTERESHRAARAVLQNVTIGQAQVILHLGPESRST